jgi:hypothetical protein
MTINPYAQPYSGQQQEQDPLAQYMEMMKGLMPNPLLNAGLGAAGSLIGGIGSLLQGPSWGDKKAKEVYSMAQNRMGQSPLQPEQYLAEFMRANAPRFNQQAEGIARRLNLDSGVAQGEMTQQQQPAIASFMLQAKQRNDELKFQNDNNLMALMAQLTGGR